MLPKTLAALSTFFVAVAVHASEPVGAARIQEQVWQESGVHAREFVVKGIKGGAEVVWRVSPRPAGMLVRQFPGAHRVLIAGPAGSYTLTAEVWTAKIAKLPAGWKEGDDVPITLSAETVTATFTLGTPGPTPPDPGPTPPVPPPTDPLAASLKAAALSDGWTAKLPALADWFRECADLTGSHRTAGELQAAAIAARRSLGRLPPAVDAVTKPHLASLDAIMPASNPGKVLSDGDRQTARALFLKLSAAASEAAR